MKLHVKNMVCDRCKLVVANILNELGMPRANIALGSIDFGDATISDFQLSVLEEKLQPVGFEVLKDKRSKMIAAIKVHLLEMIDLLEELDKPNLSGFIAQKLNKDYNYLSTLFSSVEGITIEQYFINQKIEKAKELIIYNELTLTEISCKLGYSSLAHLSSQFKRLTGLSPSHFKKLRSEKLRKSLDKV